MNRPTLWVFLRRHGVTLDSPAVDVYDAIEDYLDRYFLCTRSWSDSDWHYHVDELTRQVLCEEPLSIP